MKLNFFEFEVYWKRSLWVWPWSYGTYFI